MPCGDRVVCRGIDLLWPDEPMHLAAAHPGLDTLREYFGEPDEMLAHVGDAAILVTHLAPLSAGMLQALPRLKLVAVARGGPVNIDMAAAARHGVRVVNAPGRNASAVAEFTLGAILAETRNITRGHDALRRADWRGDLYRADITGDELSEMTVGVIGYGHVGQPGCAPVARLWFARSGLRPLCPAFGADRADGVIQTDLATRWGRRTW